MRLRAAALALLLAAGLGLIAMPTNAAGQCGHGHQPTCPPPTASPTPTVAPTATPSPSPAPPSAFLYGAFEDTSVTDQASEFQAMITDLRAHGLNAAAFTNGFIRYHLPLATVADSNSFPVVSSWAMGELHEQWYDASVTVDIATARTIIGPLVDQLRTHPWLKGYNLIDDTPPSMNEKVRLAAQVFHEHDADSPASGAMPYDIAHAAYAAIGSDAFLTYQYPAKVGEAVCSWSGTFLTGTRTAIADKPASVPLWYILQTHKTDTGPVGTVLRYPTVEEVRLQNWLALGEGARGIFWFLYSTEGPWIGFRDNPPIYAEVSSLATRTLAFPLLTKVADKAAANGNYASTMTGGGKTYVLAANTGCTPRSVTILSQGLTGSLRDVESGQTFAFGQAIPYQGGDGHLYEVVP